MKLRRSHIQLKFKTVDERRLRGIFILDPTSEVILSQPLLTLVAA